MELETYTPVMGWQSCRYMFDGTDAEDGDYYRCLTHGAISLGHEVSCDKAGEAGHASYLSAAILLVLALVMCAALGGMVGQYVDAMGAVGVE